MQNPLTHNEIRDLAASHPARDNFGPESNTPYFAFLLEDSDATLFDWLKDLPCPVIGIGHGALEKACDIVLENDKKLKRLTETITKAPLAAMVLVQHLRASEPLTIQDTLTAESFAYSSVQNGPEFQKWADNYEGKPLALSNESDLRISIEAQTLTITLNRPDTRNAIGTQMRDALCEAFDLALTDNQFEKIKLRGNGKTFSIGGAIEEFGEVSDPATAHWVRSLRLPAWRLAQLQDKLNVHVNGAAIGAGAEMAAFGSHITASPKAWFQLPELKYGLIPGAGGTASITHRIGRQKTAYMALSMEKITAKTALEWGLIDAIIN